MSAIVSATHAATGIAIAPLVLFDLDGTLVDTAADLCAAANGLRHSRGLDPIALDRLRPTVSRGGRAMLGVAFEHLDETAREALLPEFLQRYADDIARHSVLFEGIDAVLAAIDVAGSRWGIVTNKPEYLARALVDAIGLAPRCAVLIGGDTLSARKPDPLPLRHAAALLGVDAQAAVYVGDDARDVQAARAAGMKSVAAAWGYRDAQDRIEGWNADVLTLQPRDLLQPGVLTAAAAPDVRG